jgi:hypothetical protein
MTLALSVLLASASLGAIAQAPPASPAPRIAPSLPACPTPPPRFAAIALDPKRPIEVSSARQFAVALRAVEDGGYTWRLVSPLDKTAAVRADGMQSIWDSAFANLERKPGGFPMVGGAATELFLFTAAAPGTATLTFGLFGPGARSATRTTTFTVRVSPSVMVC